MTQQNDSNSSGNPPPFFPFNPAATPSVTSAPSPQPQTIEHEAQQPAKPRRASGKKPAKKASGKKPAKKASGKKAAPKKPKPDNQAIQQAQVQQAASAAPKRKRASAKPAKRAAKYDLQTILKVAGTLKEPDQKLFEKMLETLTALPKASRERILRALGQVFS